MYLYHSNVIKTIIMALFQFGKKIKHRKFDYIPRFYDPVKEEMDGRLKMYSAEAGDTNLMKARIKGGFKRKYRSDNDYIQNSRKRSNRILIVTIVLLLVITFIFISEYLPKLISSFEN